MMNGRIPLILLCIVLFALVLSPFAHGYFSYISWENQIGLNFGLGLSSEVEVTETDVSPAFAYEDRLSLEERFTLGWHLYSEDDYVSYVTSWEYIEDRMLLKSIELDMRREKQDYQIYAETSVDEEVLSKITNGMIWINRPGFWRLFYGSELTYADLTYPSLRFTGTKYEEGEDMPVRYQLVRGKVSDSEYIYGGKYIYQNPEKDDSTGFGVSFLTFEDTNYIPLDQIFTFAGIFNPNKYLTLTSEYVRTTGGDRIDLSSYQEWHSRSYYSAFHKVSLVTELYKSDYGYTQGEEDVLGYSAFVKYRTFDIFHYVMSWITGYENKESALTSDNPSREQSYSLTSVWSVFNMPSIHWGSKYTRNKDRLSTVDVDETAVYVGTGVDLWEDTYFSTQWLLTNLADLGSAATANRATTELMSHSFTTELLWGVMDINHSNAADLIEGGHEDTSGIEYKNIQTFGGADFVTELYFISSRDDRQTIDTTSAGLIMSLNKRFEGYGKTGIEYIVESFRDGLDPANNSYTSGLSYSAAFSFDIGYSETRDSMLSYQLWLVEDKALVTQEGMVKIYGYVFNDLNGNGIFDPGEPPIKNVRVKLSGKIKKPQYTDDEGLYSFELDIPRDIVLNVALDAKTLPIGFVMLDDLSKDIESKKLVHKMNFPVYGTQDISGIVFDDENRNGFLDEGESGIAGVQVLLDNGEQINYTDEDGRYRFDGVWIGMHTIQIMQTKVDDKWTSTTGLDKYIELVFDQEPEDQNLGFYIKEEKQRKVRRKVFE
ncbi:SdrD B-like domain-containing protein [Candidatus Margulisiibacteriota bacterium]